MKMSMWSFYFLSFISSSRSLSMFSYSHFPSMLGVLCFFSVGNTKMAVIFYDISGYPFCWAMENCVCIVLYGFCCPFFLSG